MWLAETNCALSKRPHAPVSHHLWQLNPSDPKSCRLSVWPEHRTALHGKWVTRVCHTVVCSFVFWGCHCFLLSENTEILFLETDIFSANGKRNLKNVLKPTKNKNPVYLDTMEWTENHVVPMTGLVWCHFFRVVTVLLLNKKDRALKLLQLLIERGGTFKI